MHLGKLAFELLGGAHPHLHRPDPLGSSNALPGNLLLTTPRSGRTNSDTEEPRYCLQLAACSGSNRTLILLCASAILLSVYVHLRTVTVYRPARPDRAEALAETRTREALMPYS